MNILITGAGKGIGKAIAEELEKDNEIFAIGRNEERLKHYKKYFICDLTDYNELEKLGEYIKNNKIDILINNAGEYIYSPIEQMSIEQIKHITKTNFEAPLYLISQAVPYMKSQNWGRIINIGSMWGKTGACLEVVYSAAKAGIRGAQ